MRNPVSDKVLNENLIIYPNSINNFIGIKSNKIIKEINIYDILGVEVYNNKVSRSDVIITNSFNSGIYFIQVETNFGIQTKKVISINMDCSAIWIAFHISIINTLWYLFYRKISNMRNPNKLFKEIALIKRVILVYLIMLYFTRVSFGQNYDPDFFPIGVWSVRGDFRPVDEFLFNIETAASFHHTSFKNLHNQGFNAAYLSYDPIVNTLDTILDIAKQNDIRVIANMSNLHYLISQSNNITVTESDIIQAIENDSIDLLKASPAVLGYYLYDEPLPGWIDFDVLESAKYILTNITSDSPKPILSTWNDETKMSYVDSYLNLDVLMMDAYPFEDNDAIGDISQYMPSSFATNLIPYSDYINSVRENHCDAQNRPMWVVLQSFGDLETPENGGYWRQVYPKEIRLQVYLSIMQGAKGIWYFLYESEYPYLLGLLDVSGQPTQRLLEVMDINTEINAIRKTLLKLNVVDDQTGVSTDLGEVKLHFDSSTDNQEKYIIAVNTDVFAASNPTISIHKNTIGYDVLSIINEQNNQTIAFTETANELIISTSIEAGSGLLLKLSQEPSKINDVSLRNRVQIYPNPVKDNLYIHTNYNQANSYELYNIFGDRIKKGKIQDNKAIDLSSIIEGIYFIRVKTQKGFLTYKVLKV